jgi:hypothetical protein
LIATRYFGSDINGSKEPDKIIMRTPQNHDSFPWSINKSKHIIQIRLQIERGRTTRKRDYIKRTLVKMHFGFILLLALGAVVDSHVEL